LRKLALLVLISGMLAACGGGGSGGSTPPTSPGGGPPPPGSTPSPVPSSHPTSTPVGPSPTPVATPTPFATPTPSGGGITILPDTTGRFGLTQIFDWDGVASHAPMSASQITSEAPHEDAVWGAFYPSTWNAAHPGMIVSRYMLPVEDDSMLSGHDLNWWQTNHPDWILYACKSDGTPTRDLAWTGTSFPDVPLDFSNPAVIQYQMNLLIPYMKENGYTALAADNTDLLNYVKGGNPNFGETPQAGEYGCGTYDSSGNFHRSFDGPLDSNSPADPAFVAAMVNWVKTVDADVHAAGLKLLINHPLYNPPTDPNEEQMIASVDGMVDENGYTRYGNFASGNTYAFTLEWIEYLQAHRVAVLVTDYFCLGSSCSNDVNSLSPQQVDWALASYAIGNEGGEDMYTSPSGGQEYSYRSEYSTGYGAPCSSYTQPASYVYERKFQSALVIVNATSSSYSFPLPSNHTYRDIEGQTLANPLTMPPTSGYVLLTSNGCS